MVNIQDHTRSCRAIQFCKGSKIAKGESVCLSLCDFPDLLAAYAAKKKDEISWSQEY